MTDFYYGAPYAGLQRPVYVPAWDSRPIFDGSFLSKDVVITDDYSGTSYTNTHYNPGLGTSNPQAVINTLNAIAANAGKPGFNWLDYVNQAYVDNLMNPSWNAGGGNKWAYSGWVGPVAIVNSILAEAAKVDPAWQKAMYSAAEVSASQAQWQATKQAASTGGGVIGQIVSGATNIVSVLALPAALLALPLVLGQPSIYGAIADSVSGATAVAPAVDATTPLASAGESAASAVQSASSLDVTDLSNLASGGAGSVDVGATVAATPVDTAALSGSVDIATGATIPASITAAADATGTSLTSIAQDALKAVGGTPATAAKYAAGLLATMAAGAPKPATRAAVANQAGIGNPLVIGAAALLLLAVVKRK